MRPSLAKSLLPLKPLAPRGILGAADVLGHREVAQAQYSAEPLCRSLIVMLTDRGTVEAPSEVPSAAPRVLEAGAFQG
jgi:hypothetical protein